MSKAPAMPMYWDAYLADTTHLTTEEHGAYMLLLAAMWRRNGAVPDDDRDNARILGLTPSKWRKIKARLTDTISGFHADGDNITQEKLRKTWENTQEKIAKNAMNGAKGGRAAARKNNSLAQANATKTPERKRSIPEPEPEPYKEPSGSFGELALPLEKPPPKKITRSVQIPDGWVPSDKNIQDAEAKGFSAKEIDHEADQFRDYHLARGSKFKSWDAAWRTWLGNARKFAANRGMAGQASGSRHGQGSSIASIVAQRRLGS